MPDIPGPIVDFEQVSVRFDETWALRNVSFKLNPGETHIILGAAGSGKTTLLKAVIGLVRVDEGEIKLFGQSITSLTEHDLYPLRSRIGVLFQEGGLFDSLSVGDNVEYPLLNQQNPHRQNRNGQPVGESSSIENQARDALRFVELEQTFDKFPSELSGGMRRRVGIARAIVTEPPLVLYDSPTAGLDPITANTIMALILKERDVTNTASLIVTHRFQDGDLMAEFRYDPQQQEVIPLPEGGAARHRTRFIVMKEGGIVFFGTRAELASSSDEYVRRFVKHEE
jgi:phospholipid/cholesterol/gamma-HCH transport system ATP-binding protein